MQGIVWFEIYVDDLQAAAAFYSRTFGWMFTPLRDYSEDYWTIQQIESRIGGALVKVGTQLSRAIAGAGTCVVYSEVEDLAQSLEDARLAGAKIEKDVTQITADAGFFAVIRTPEGTLAGLWSEKLRTSS